MDFQHLSFYGALYSSNSSCCRSRYNSLEEEPSSVLETLCRPDLSPMLQNKLFWMMGGAFFIKKILDLCVSLDATKNLCSVMNRHSSHCSSMSFTTFRCVHMDYLRKLVLRLRVPQNPVPTNTMLDCLDRLQFDIGISVCSLSCTESYLSNRTQCISIVRVLLNIFNLKFGVHKAAFRGHFIFSLC